MIAPFVVTFDVPGIGAWTPTTEILSFSLSAGRQNALDTYGASNGEIVFRRTSANSTELSRLRPDIEMTIQDVDVVGPGGRFKITDVISDYGIVSTLDTVTITFEGALAEANRAYLDDYNLASGTLTDQALDVETESGVVIAVTTLNDPQCDGTTVTSVADWLQQLVTTIDGRIDDTLYIQLYDRFTSEAFDDLDDNKLLVFSDGAVGGGERRIYYDQIVFTSLAENYYTRAIVDPENHAAQVSTSVSASAPYRVLQLNTFNASTAQAKDYANFLLSTYSDPTHKRVSSVSVDGASTNASRLYPNLCGYAIGKTCKVVLNLVTHYAVIEGWAYTATPENDRYTFYFSGADLNNYLILDDADRGVLDANRLGY